MAEEFDPEAPMGWIGEGENRRPITYPDPTWESDIDHAIRTDLGARWWFSRTPSSRRDLELRYPGIWLPPLPTSQQVSPLPPSPSSSSSANPPALPASSSAPVLLQPPPPSSQQQQQQQQQRPQQPKPQFPGPLPGQVFIRMDHCFACQICNFTRDRRERVISHIESQHPGVNAAQEIFDWGMIMPRYR